MMEDLSCVLYSDVFYDNVDLNIVDCGIQFKTADHRYNYFFDHYVLQYMMDGEGFLEIRKQKYKLTKGDLFLLPAGEQCLYYADKDNPYQYYWVGFFGLMTEKYLSRIGFSPASPVKHVDDETMDNIFSELIKFYRQNSPSSSVLALISLYKIFGFLLEKEPIVLNQPENKYDYIKKALVYIHQHYNTNITIDSLSEYLNLNRSYFSVIFKSKMKCGPKEYLTKYRILKAQNLLQNTDYSIGYIAELVGINNPINFSASFKKLTAFSPREYRQNHQAVNSLT